MSPELTLFVMSYSYEVAVLIKFCKKNIDFIDVYFCGATDGFNAISPKDWAPTCFNSFPYTICEYANGHRLATTKLDGSTIFCRWSVNTRRDPCAAYSKVWAFLF